MKIKRLEISDKWRNSFIFILISLPILALLLNALSWLKFGIDIPFYDDWRPLLQNKIGNLDWSYLFKSSNDTLYPVGKILDSLFYRYLNGNNIAYQFLSIISVLGLLLFLQWRLLSLTVNDKLLVACAFSFTLFMLVPNTYWGKQSMAYHQALPLVFLLTAIYLVLGARWHQWRSAVILVMLGLLAGFSYISGAFSTLVVSIVFITSSYFIQASERKPLLQGGLALLFSSIITVPAQVNVIINIQKGTHRPDLPMAYPFEMDFWLFFLGKIGRALMLPANAPIPSLIISSIAVVIIVSAAIYFGRIFTKSRMNTLLNSRLTIIFITLSSFLFVYLCLVCAGRTNGAHAALSTISPIEIFSSGFGGFHFFWVTLLWPWLIVSLVVIAKKVFLLKKIPLAEVLTISIFLFVIPHLFIRGAFNSNAYYKSVMESRAAGVQCLITHVQNNQTIHCPQLSPQDLTKEFLNAKKNNLSFTRTIPFTPIPIGEGKQSLLLDLRHVNTKNLKFNHIENLSYINGIYTLKTAHDPMIFLKTKIPQKMKECVLLEISVRMRVSTPDIAQIFYKTIGQSDFKEATSVVSPIVANGEFNEIYFQAISPAGFTNELRFDPVTGSNLVEIKDFEVKCRFEKTND
jgi:hypothetical protein